MTPKGKGGNSRINSSSARQLVSREGVQILSCHCQQELSQARRSQLAGGDSESLSRRSMNSVELSQASSSLFRNKGAVMMMSGEKEESKGRQGRNHGYHDEVRFKKSGFGIHEMIAFDGVKTKSCGLTEQCMSLSAGGSQLVTQNDRTCSIKTLRQSHRRRHQPCRLPLLGNATTRVSQPTQFTVVSAILFARLIVASSQSVAAQAPLIADGLQATPMSRYRSSGSNQPTALITGRRPSSVSLLTQSSSGSSAGSGSSAHIPQNWARGLAPVYDRAESNSAATSNADQSPLSRDQGAAGNTNSRAPSNSNLIKSVRSIAAGAGSASTTRQNSTSASPTAASNSTEDICADRLCYGLPMGCLGSSRSATTDGSSQSSTTTAASDQSAAVSSPTSLCSVLVTSKRFIDPNRPVLRDILFELIALPVPEIGNYAAVGFSETGRMQGLVSECLQHRDPKTQLQIIRLKHSYSIPGIYTNVPVKVLSGIKNLGVTYENGFYQCRWIVESGVEFSYEAFNGSIIIQREDLGYKNYHILLATGEFDYKTDMKSIHTDRVSSMAPVSLAQTGHIKSLGSHILIRIHGSLMIAIWVGFVTLSIVLARYYKNEWSNSKINDLAIWFVVHRTLMLASWFGSIIAVIFAYMYTETYHPGLHQVSGTTCLVLSTVQVLGGLFRPSHESSKRVYFNWAHFTCGNLSYLFAMICLVTAAFLAPAHLPPLYIWVIVAFVGTYALTHLMMTIHQYIVHKSSKISITPMSDLNSTSSTSYTSCTFFTESSYPKEVNSSFRQFMLGTLVTIIVIFIVLLISLVNIK